MFALEHAGSGCSLILHYETMTPEEVDRLLNVMQDYGLQVNAPDSRGTTFT